MRNALARAGTAARTRWWLTCDPEETALSTDHHDPTVTRRQALRIGGIALGASALAAGGLLAWDAVRDRAHPLAGVRRRWLARLTGGPVREVDADAEGLLDRLGRGGRWTDLALADREQRVALRISAERLRRVARAYATPGSRHEHDPRLRDLLLEHLDRLHADYARWPDGSGNWWDREVGVPLQLTAASLLLYDDLGDDRLHRWMTTVHERTPAPSYTAANRAWTGRVVVERALLLDDPDALVAGLRGMTPAWRPVREGDGVRPDGSFLQHDVHPYSGGYGLSLLTSAASVLALLHGTPWQAPADAVDDLVRWVDQGLAPWLHDGAVLAPVRGRNVARASVGDGAAARTAASALRLLARAVDDEDAQRLTGLAAWVSPDTDGGVPPPVGTRVFPAMDRVVHRRPGFVLALALSSSRVAGYESIGAENLHGWYTGSGATFLYDGPGSPYDDHFWPTVDATRVPGTTVARGTPADAAGAGTRPRTHWAGGAALGSLAAIGMAFDHPPAEGTAPVRGRKSWFLLDDEVVALGAGIASAAGRPVETVVDNRRLADPAQRLLVDGWAVPRDAAAPTAVDDARWAHLSAPGSATGVGYVFRPGQRVRLLRERRTGRWSDINRSAPHRDATVRTNGFATVWLEHGTDPADGRYGYVLLPGTTAQEVAARAAAPRTEVLADSPAVQAVRRGGTVALNVWQERAPETGGVRCDRPAAVLVVEEEGRLTVALADPTQRLDRDLRVMIARSARGVAATHDRVRVERHSPAITLVADLRGARGATVTATFDL
ncbi:polysaccharide lyase 8 family protein [Promicromonospora citrea]|uniref:polysaccharide lyase 8 family protein n=1 Tax=Promicromonospora citrea TaxID=43677 RepID=UPI0014878CBD|nr:polysaccharide lyase 8 family protein [Promicromonospora citrea]NNH53571.1 polysaccharide lyase 8 family protein [Promicromonospora citrea]